MRLLLVPVAFAAAAWAVDVESAKRILADRWQAVKTQSIDERRILFQDVRVISDRGGTTELQVTALTWDYTKGYPKNRYWGTTCVSKYEKQPFTIIGRGTTWQIGGAFNPQDYATCKDNPGEGVSAIPLNTLPGKEAGAAAAAAAPPMSRSGGLAIGKYECWAYGRARMLLNLTIETGNRYRDSAGKQGAFEFNPANRRVTFRGGMRDGGLPAGTYASYEERSGVPTLSVRAADGAEVSFCEGK